MMKKYKLAKVKNKRSYTLNEVAEVYGIHVRTVQSWIKNGLKPLEGSRNPYYVMGSDIRDYLAKQYKKTHVKLKPREFYCLSCRIGVVPHEVEILYNAKIGKGESSYRLLSKCPLCNKKINKFTTQTILFRLGMENLETQSRIIWDLEYPLKH